MFISTRPAEVSLCAIFGFCKAPGAVSLKFTLTRSVLAGRYVPRAVLMDLVRHHTLLHLVLYILSELISCKVHMTILRQEELYLCALCWSLLMRQTAAVLMNRLTKHALTTGARDHGLSPQWTVRPDLPTR